MTFEDALKAMREGKKAKLYRKLYRITQHGDLMYYDIDKMKGEKVVDNMQSWQIMSDDWEIVKDE